MTWERALQWNCKAYIRSNRRAFLARRLLIGSQESRGRSRVDDAILRHCSFCPVVQFYPDAHFCPDARFCPDAHFCPDAGLRKYIEKVWKDIESLWYQLFFVHKQRCSLDRRVYWLIGFQGVARLELRCGHAKPCKVIFITTSRPSLQLPRWRGYHPVVTWIEIECQWSAMVYLFESANWLKHRVTFESTRMPSSSFCLPNHPWHWKCHQIALHHS